MKTDVQLNIVSGPIEKLLQIATRLPSQVLDN